MDIKDTWLAAFMIASALAGIVTLFGEAARMF